MATPPRERLLEAWPPPTDADEFLFLHCRYPLSNDELRRLGYWPSRVAEYCERFTFSDDELLDLVCLVNDIHGLSPEREEWGACRIVIEQDAGDASIYRRYRGPLWVRPRASARSIISAIATSDEGTLTQTIACVVLPFTRDYRVRTRARPSDYLAVRRAGQARRGE